MEKNSTIKISLPSLILSLVIIFLIGYAVIDATFNTPKINQKVEEVSEEFDSLKVYLDTKIPEIDEALILHDIQIKRQEEQLKRLHKLTESIKED